MKQLRYLTLIALIVVLAQFPLAGCSGDSAGDGDYQKLGMKAFSDGNYPKAREYLRKALEKRPSDKDLLYFTGLAYQRDFVLDSAFYFIKRTSLLYPDDKEVLEQLYAVASMVGEYNDARKALMDLIAKGDPLEKHLENLVDMLYKSGSIANLYYYLVKWYREYGLEDQSRFRLLASYAAKVDSFEVANEVLDSAVKRWGDSDDFELVRSEILFNEGKMADAEKILRALVAKYPDNLDFKTNLANCLSNQNKIPKIDEALDIMKSIRAQVSDRAKIDSVITQMEDHREQVLHPEAADDKK